MTSVSFVKVEDVDQLKQAIPQALDLIDFKFPKNMQKIVLKPNMCYYWDHTTGETTHPKMVTTIIDLLNEQTSSDVNISIVESDASAMKCKPVFKFLGYEKIAKQYENVNLVNLSEVEAETVNVNVQGQNFDFMVPKIITEADLRINLPKMKYMEISKISGALKNIFGCNPYPQKFKLHSKLNEAIVAINKVMKFDLSIMDGFTVTGSKVTKLGLLMASQDPVAMDTAVAKILKVNPNSIKQIQLAEKEGLGQTSFTPKGFDLKYFKDNFPHRSLTDKTVSLGYNAVCKLGLDNRLFF